MPDIIHTLPCLLRSEADLPMARACLASLAASEPGARLLLCNQGYLDNDGLRRLLAPYALDATVLGNGTNIGIAAGRATCFRWLWANHPDTVFVTEIHLDMLFPVGWSAELADFLTRHPDEPLICPGLLTARSEVHPEGVAVATVPSPYWEHAPEILARLPALRRNTTMPGFVHPVMHRAQELQAVGGYDTRFLVAHQGYEDDSLLIGYRLRIGLRSDWRPKCYLGTTVFHATLAQRLSLGNVNQAFDLNLEGLILQYGVRGIEELSAIYPTNEDLRRLARGLTEHLAAKAAHGGTPPEPPR